MQAGGELVILSVEGSLTEAPMTVERIEELMSNKDKDNKQPDDPQCDVGHPRPSCNQDWALQEH